MDSTFLLSLGQRHTDLAKLHRYYIGEQEDICRQVFNQVLTAEQQAELNFYRLYVNLTAPSVDRFVSGVYGGVVSRTIEDGSPYKAELDEFLSPGRGYSQTVREWFSNAVLFGTGYLAFEVMAGKVVPYLPNPIYTAIETEAWDKSKITSLTEWNADGEHYKVIDTKHYGVYRKDSTAVSVTPHGIGICPVAVCYGKSQVSMGCPYGLSLVKDSIKYSEVISRIQLAALQLVLTYTRPQAYLTGEIRTLTDNPETEISEMLAPGGVAHLKDGQFGFASPNSRFEDLLKIIAHIVKQYCLSTGLPLDALDGSTVDPNQSATAARLRNQPLKTALQRLTEGMKYCEIYALQVVAAVMQWLETEGEVTFSDVQERVRVNVSMQPVGSPESRVEEVTADIQLYTIGAKTLEDLVRKYGENLSEAEIAKRVSEKTATADALSSKENAPETPEAA